MLLRIFLFGLIAIGKGDQRATILVLNQDTHDAYVAFDKNTCPGCGHYHLPNVDRSIRGYSLQDGYELTFNAVPAPGPEPRLRFAGGRNDPTLPRTADEAADFRWVTSIPAILGQGGNATQCIKDPKRCSGVAIAARMQVTAATLQTCHLVQTLGGKCRDSAVYPFNFDSPTSLTSRPTSPLASAAANSSHLPAQAMASAVEVVIEIAEAKSITLALTKFGAKDPSTTITLTPTACKGLPKGMCIDVFVGNITKEDYSNPLNIKKALHFPAFFGLLDDSAAVSVTPTIDETDCVNIQPVCRTDYPGVASYEKRLRRKGWLTFERHEGPLSRPICPLAMVAE